ncbi:MAG: DUF6152 family protein [Steroidobacteraceae bacterium]
MLGVLMLSALFAGLPDQAQAHHSFAMFDTGKCQVMSGTVTQVSMSYPHVWVWVINETEGKEVTWAFEGPDPSTLRVRGWAPNSIKKGDKVTIAFNPLLDGRAGGSFKQLKMPDQRVFAMPSAGLPGEFKCELTNTK